MPKKESTIEEKKAEVLMHLRGYKKIDQKRLPDGITTYTTKTKTGDIIIYCIPGQGTIGVQYINKLKKVMKDENLERGIIITSGRYTQAAKSAARKRGIELIPRMFPAFNLFEHVMVPKHEIISDEERQMILQKYKVQPYQLPYIHVSDPAVKAVGAKPGDIVKITRNSQTAGKYFAYRYVVEG
ncbi:DNA-directed RNA polymerase subunit H [Candidatus Bathyarchaeota archaeon A05DMB-4]|nr:DNA-directed RNA polymerase subunit H [Candidatus Bathyarchaeota archaeon A05DMB-4]